MSKRTEISTAGVERSLHADALGIPVLVCTFAVAAFAEVASLLRLTAASLLDDLAVSEFAGRVSYSAGGGWTIKPAIDEGLPVPVLSAAASERFSSRGESHHKDNVLSAIPYRAGAHFDKPAGKRAACRRKS